MTGGCEAGGLGCSGFRFDIGIGCGFGTKLGGFWVWVGRWACSGFEEIVGVNWVGLGVIRTSGRVDVVSAYEGNSVGGMGELGDDVVEGRDKDASENQ